MVELLLKCKLSLCSGFQGTQTLGFLSLSLSLSLSTYSEETRMRAARH